MHAGKTVIIIAGPTAVGKTAVAIALAQHLKTEIISADSRQCYRELHIGVARPSAAALAQVPHHFIASHSVTDKVTAGVFEDFALQQVHEVFKKNNVVVLTGGTGLYIKAFCEGLDAIPDVPDAIRSEVIENYSQHGLAWLQQQVQERDPLFYARSERANPHRLMRALEVYKATGTSIETFRRGHKTKRDFTIIKTALCLPKEDLHRNIHNRVEDMMKAGLPDEVKHLAAYKNLAALQTVGYSEMFEYLEGTTSLEEAVELIKRNTRRYAKRQLTWFRKDAGYTWFAPDVGAIMDFLKS